MKEEITIHTFGAKLNSADDRNIHIASVVAPKPHPSKNITDMSMFAHENQQSLGSCVGQSEGKGEEVREYRETGKVVRISKRFIYARCKQLDGDPNQGTYPAIAAKVLREEGAPRAELIVDDNFLSHADYINITVTDEVKTDASGHRVAGNAFCYTLEDIKTAIDTAGVMNATLIVGNWVASPLQPVPPVGMHRALFFGYEDAINPKTGQPDTKIYDFNSWGDTWCDQGNGWFWWSENEGKTYDMMVYLDMPDTIIDYAKKQQYRFTRILHRDMTGTDVLELQKRLAKELATDGLPCYQSTTFDTHFGPITENAVKRYQVAHGLVSHGTWQTTGYGQIGPKTMAMLNSAITPPPQNKIEAWADATQQREGWYVGSRSYKNNNPGNLKYVGQALAIGQDSKGFCIFKSYTDGRKCLTDMFIRAATPPPEGYYPEMTLLQFYEKYAPKSDNNDPAAYAQFVAQKVGVTVDTPIKNLV